MAARRAKSRKWLLPVLIAVVVIAVSELGAYFGILDWRSLFESANMTASDTSLSGTLEVCFLDVGNADCVILKQGTHAMMIDAGERGDIDEIKAGLNRFDVDRLELVIATHPHADHIGSMAALIREVEIDQFWMSFMPEDETPTTAVYMNMLEALDEKKVPVSEVLPGDTYDLGGARVHILAPINEDDDPNAMSVVTRVDYGDHRFLFTGDAEEEVEQDLLDARADLKADVLKVGHHGSRTGTCDDFLRAVSPAYAVITSGAENAYGHPHKQVLDALEEAQVTTYRSDLNGDVVITSNGNVLMPSCERSSY